MWFDQRVVVATLAILAASCGGSSPQPTAPSAATPPSPVATPAPDATIDLAGRYQVTFTAAESCDQLPTAVRTRTFTAVMSRVPWNPTLFTAELSGAAFYSGYGSFWAVVRGDEVRLNVASWDAFERWLEDQPIIERLAPTSHVSLIGTTTGPAMTSASEISTTFNGSFLYCPASIIPTPSYFPLLCQAPTDCTSDQHHLRLVRQ